MELQTVRKNVERFIRAMDEEFYLNFAGLKEEMNTSAIFRRHKGLFDRRVLTDIKKRRTKARGDDKRKLRYLEHVLVAGHIEQKVKDLSDRNATMESKLKVTVRGEKIPFRLAAVKLFNEDDRELRDEIYEARNRAIDDLNVLLEKRLRKLHGLAATLGYRNYADMYSKIKKINFDKVMRELDALIKATDRMYRDRLGALMDGIGIGIDEAEKHDVGYILRAKPFDRYFRKRSAIPTLKRTLKGLGIALEGQKNVILDADERPKKSPRAFCAPLKVPDKIMLVIMPMGGYGDYDTLLHEAGHAEHYAHVHKKEEMEYKYLGDNSVTESNAFLLQYLTMNEDWIKSNIPMDQGKLQDYFDFVYTKKLFFLRRYAAKLMYELNLHKKGLKNMGAVYKRTLESVLGFKHPENHFLTDLDDGFYAAQYLRAWLFEAQLRRKLIEDFGDGWFQSTDAGDYIKSLWA
ncbi:MAG: hypothetical protein KAI64_00175, partial [Thermoplasmata archaeon]|nr:hypothetical protein [Thermoplasmata archaeon]